MPRCANSRLRLTLTAALLAIVLTFAFSAGSWAFPDVPAGHAYGEAIDELSQRGIIGGYANGSFGLNDPVKRAQFAKMIVGTLGFVPNASTNTRFTDLGSADAGGYPHKYVQTAYDHGITLGTDPAQTLFAPWNSIRRDQVVSMTVRGIKGLYPAALVNPPSAAVSLFGGVAEPHGQNLRIAEYNGLLDGLIGMGAGWSVAGVATRGEVAQMLWNTLVLLDDGASPPSTTPPTTAPPTQTRVVWVYANGTGDYPTLEAAVAALGAGSTINLGPGTFTLAKTLLVDHALTLVGAGWQTGKTLVTYPGTVVSVTGARFSCENVRFVSTANAQSSSVVRAENADVEFRSCYFAGGKRLNESNGSGLYLLGTTTAVIKDCVSTKNDHCGISIDHQADVVLETNTCTSNGAAGILFDDDSQGVVSNNYCSYNGTRGITVQDRATAVLEDNKCLSNTRAGIAFLGQSQGAARRNECSGNMYGIYVESTANPTIENNNKLYGNTVDPQLYDERLL